MLANHLVTFLAWSRKNAFCLKHKPSGIKTREKFLCVTYIFAHFFLAAAHSNCEKRGSGFPIHPYCSYK